MQAITAAAASRRFRLRRIPTATPPSGYLVSGIEFGRSGYAGDPRKGEFAVSPGRPTARATRGTFARMPPMATIDREQVLHVARLAQLALTEDELERLGAQLNDILQAVAKVGELDLDDVEPTSHPLEVVNVWDEDESRPCLTVEQALGNAPEREGDFFKVPPVG